MSSRSANRVTSKWLSIVVFLCVLSVCGYVGQSYGQTVDLLPFLEKWQKQPVEITNSLSLKPEWIGTVKRAYLRDPLGIHKEDEPNDIRFNEVFARRSLIWTNEPLRLSIVRIRKSPSGGGHYVGSDAPKFYAKLPTLAELSKAKHLSELKEYFGNQHGITSGWGGLDGRLNWNEGWICFTIEAKDRLRYLSVSASVSKSKEDKDASINRLSVKEGEFRPANPDSAEEKAKYKTGESLYAEEVARLKASWEKYPMPLRRLVAAEQKPGDSELKAYKKEIEAFRAKPDKKLLKQLIHQLHDDGTVEFSGMLDALFDDGHFLGATWNKESRKQAVRLLAETLPEIKKSDVLQKVILKVLAMQGGGEFKMESKTAVWEIELSFRFVENGYSTSEGVRPKDSQVPQAALECLAELKKRYPVLWRK